MFSLTIKINRVIFGEKGYSSVLQFDLTLSYGNKTVSFDWICLIPSLVNSLCKTVEKFTNF